MLLLSWIPSYWIFTVYNRDEYFFPNPFTSHRAVNEYRTVYSMTGHFMPNPHPLMVERPVDDEIWNLRTLNAPILFIDEPIQKKMGVFAKPNNIHIKLLFINVPWPWCLMIDGFDFLWEEIHVFNNNLSQDLPVDSHLYCSSPDRFPLRFETQRMPSGCFSGVLSIVC